MVYNSAFFNFFVGYFEECSFGASVPGMFFHLFTADGEDGAVQRILRFLQLIIPIILIIIYRLRHDNAGIIMTPRNE